MCVSVRRRCASFLYAHLSCDLRMHSARQSRAQTRAHTHTHTRNRAHTWITRVTRRPLKLRGRSTQNEAPTSSVRFCACEEKTLNRTEKQFGWRVIKRKAKNRKITHALALSKPDNVLCKCLRENGGGLHKNVGFCKYCVLFEQLSFFSRL